MNDDPTINPLVDGESIEAERLAALRRAVIEADAADVILLSGMSREDWLVQLDRAAAEDAKASEPG